MHLSFVDPRCQRASLTSKQPLRLDGENKSSGRRWGSPAHLASFFVAAQMRGRSLTHVSDQCPLPSPSRSRPPTMQLRPKRKTYAGKSIGARQHELFRSLALSSLISPRLCLYVVGVRTTEIYSHNQSSRRPTSMAILISSLVHGILFADPDGLFGLANVFIEGQKVVKGL
jgi:hypothetical protein